MRALFDLPAAYAPSDADRAAAVPAVTAVLFDFSNTLFHMIALEEWLSRIAHDTGRALDDPDAVVAAIDAAAALPEVREAQIGRDLSPERHRDAMLAWFSRVGFLAGAEEAAHARVVAGDSWVPYPDTAEVLHRLAAAGVPVGVVSDIGWDIRAHAVAAGLDHLVGTWVLSYEVGREKPDPELFARACADLGADPRATLMVGDNPVRDGGAVAAGLRAFVLAGEQRSGARGLADALRLVGPRESTGGLSAAGRRASR